MAYRIFLGYRFNWLVAVYWNTTLRFHSCIRLQGEKNQHSISNANLVTDHNTPWGFGSPGLTFSWSIVFPLCHVVSQWMKCRVSGVERDMEMWGWGNTARRAEGQEHYEHLRKTEEHVGSWPKSASSDLTYSLSIESVVWEVLVGKSYFKNYLDLAPKCIFLKYTQWYKNSQQLKPIG